ncbi:uncharacterized protein LOC119988403 [Tripterygium wilfordii]|uniref:uncharacterized protein LOC119988403 n=1 Tax=Tripterygium wilfordii TaxID=458696 RepID=UPI0018F85E4B|nr:uncharacterized protein LOC119988403 [Tripterygium wilfordii]
MEILISILIEGTVLKSCGGEFWMEIELAVIFGCRQTFVISPIVTCLHNDIIPLQSAGGQLVYSKVNGCTDMEPENPSNITHDVFATIINNMMTYWPDVGHPNTYGWREDFWRSQFERHGMCFDFPNRPIFYFLVMLHLARKFDNILDILNQG